MKVMPCRHHRTVRGPSPPNLGNLGQGKACFFETQEKRPACLTQSREGRHMDVGEAAEGQTILKLIKGQRSLGVILKRTASH